MNTYQTLLEATITTTMNNKPYGSKKESFDKISKIASLLTGKNLTDKDCCLVLIALKLSRESNLHKDDNMVDLCGYAGILNELHAN